MCHLVIHHHLGWPQNHGVIASRDQAGTAPTDAQGARLAGAQSARAVAPSRADDQRPFDRLRCRLAGADFLEVFAAERFFGAATARAFGADTARAGVSSGDATAWEMISPASVSGRLPNLMRRNTAAFCASNPRRAAVNVRASQGSIGYSPMTQCDASRSQPLLGVRVPTSAANTQYKTEPPGCGQTPLPNALFRTQRPKMIRKVSNFDQTTTQKGGTFPPEPRV
jgi:hypothetical protein